MAPQPSVHIAPRSVLLVEDDADISASLTDLLSGEGYDVFICENGRDALERLRRGAPPDLILLDLMMPVMDGWQFRVHQKEDPRLASIPVLVISADGTPKAAAIDADVYLHKPLDVDVLLSTIERTFVDLEHRRGQARQAETERLAALGTLAAGLAHEINNPLAYAMANLELHAKLAEVDAERSTAEGALTRAALAHVRDGCQRIRSIVRDLQLFSRTDDAQAGPTDVHQVLDSSANIAAAEIRPRARLTKDYRPVPPVAGAPSRVGQVLLNLILNAAQAIPEGSPLTNEVCLATHTGADGSAIIEVSDTGEGIRPEVQARMFDPFFTTKPVGSGTGLGLSISHRLVTAMNGELTVRSLPGHGTTFRVRLPASLVATPVAAPTAPAPARPREQRARILVIDDEPLILAMLERLLGRFHRVDTATRGADAIERIQKGERFDLILCDLMMPGKTGMDVADALLAIAPDQAARMVLITGGAFSPQSRQFLARWADSARPVVEKPFVVDELLAQIDQVLEKAGPLPPL